MGRFINLEGERFGRLTVLRRLENLRPGATRWLCKCDCGGTTVTYTSNLKNGSCRSCGCLHIEAAREQGIKSAKHGMCNTRLFRVWSNMKTRCYNKKNKSYERWGMRGIYVCDEWKNDFKAFYDWAMRSGYNDGLTIDRIDNNGPYSPENCRWVTPYECNHVVLSPKENAYRRSSWAGVKMFPGSSVKCTKGCAKTGAWQSPRSPHKADESCGCLIRLRGSGDRR